MRCVSKAWSSRGLSSSSLSSSPLLKRSHFPNSDPSPGTPSRHPLYQHCLLSRQLSSVQLPNTRGRQSTAQQCQSPLPEAPLGDLPPLSRYQFSFNSSSLWGLCSRCRVWVTIPGTVRWGGLCGQCLQHLLGKQNHKIAKVSWTMSLVNKYQQRLSFPEQRWKLWTIRSAQASLPAQPSQEPEPGAAPLFLFLSLSRPVSLATLGGDTRWLPHCRWWVMLLAPYGRSHGNSAALKKIPATSPALTRWHQHSARILAGIPAGIPAEIQLGFQPGFNRDSAGIPAGLLRAAGAEHWAPRWGLLKRM